MSPKRLGQSIKRLRENRGMTQLELAKKARVSQPYLSQLEAAGKANPSVDLVARIAKALGVALEDLLR